VTSKNFVLHWLFCLVNTDESEFRMYATELFPPKFIFKKLGHVL
jgi:hypothetical protein